MDTAPAGWSAPEWESVTPRRRWPTRFAGLLLAAVSVVLGFRVGDSDGITPVPQLLAFLPWLLAPAGLGLAISTLALWRTGMVWGMAVVFGLIWYMDPYGKISEPTGAAVAELRVMTSNVQFGRATDALIAAVEREKPAIVFVEECEYACSRALEDAFGGSGGAFPYREAVEGAGSDGSVILSRFPLKGADGLPGTTMGMPGAVADVQGHDVRLQLAHPMPPLPGQVGVWRRELGELRDYAAAGDGPTILAGDFNASQDHAAFRRILDTGLRDSSRLDGDTRDPSWPVDTAPPLGVQIDHVLVSEEFSVNKAGFLDLTGSDHRALVVDLTLHQRG
ncbi:endonuclease/exonuclease/phosphatase family protein [Streptomyces sp. NBC_00620]|uniref:endonuclease/exonuclease/phosphatase family protein n=1 Tax=Streptomyces sp. NBC_00620 TaxID=2903666 RepID=UPI00224FC7EB|nr:endonuclease/exonuclease/phosphatase family protein [Streptomyces sp. NBC_00620]MCX4972907.1 endonuclease/exonuclease/phosphatase family protein [Streptomyces sp. NBC_00620]